MFDLKKNLAIYMSHFDGSFVGFFETVSEVLRDLGNDWTEYGKKEWGQAFISSADELMKISKLMAKIKDERDKEVVAEDGKPPVLKSIEEYQKKIEKILSVK
jgi:hypothetical protein